MPTHWGDPSNILQLALAIVGALTLIFLYLQAARTAQAAEAALRSVAIQEAQLKQWFGIGNWLCQLRVRDDGSHQIFYGFNITNPTQIPLDVRRITVVSGEAREDSTFPTLLIPPQGGYEVGSFFGLEPESERHFRSSGLVRTFEITVEFTDPFHPAHGVTRSQTYLCVFRAATPKVDVRLQPTQLHPALGSLILAYRFWLSSLSRARVLSSYIQISAARRLSCTRRRLATWPSNLVSRFDTADRSLPRSRTCG